MGKSQLPSLMDKLSPYINTNMDSGAIMDVGYLAYNIVSGGKSVKQAQFPIIDDVHVKGGTYKDAGWVWLYDKNSVVVLTDYIYENIPMEENDYLKDNESIELNY